jgi:spermidine synthase
MPIQRLIILLILFFISGMAGLLYQVMWMKELSLLFGGSTQSAAVTISAFFLGLGLGANKIGAWVNQYKRRRSLAFHHYLKIYALIEIAIALSALLYFAIYPLFTAVYGQFYDTISPTWLVALKLFLAVPLLSVPAFFMGGTLPVMAELVVDVKQHFASRVSNIYFINTLGACAGAIAGGFVLPENLGFRITYFIAIGLSLSLAIASAVYSIFCRKPKNQSQSQSVKTTSKQVPLPISISLMAAWSGFASLALQVLWTRLFAQVLQNSTYTFSAILVVFLLSLALGALLAQRLTRVAHTHIVLPIVFLISGFFIALTPWLYMQMTNDMTYIGGSGNFADYLVSVLGVVSVVIGPAVVSMGVTLPFLYKLVEQHAAERYAAMVGKINAINTFSAIAGSAAAGFLLFQWLGTWQAIYSMALCYVLFGVVILANQQKRVSSLGWTTIVGLCLAVIFLNPNTLPVVPIDPIGKQERLLEYWETSAGTVAVVEKDGNLKTKLNNWYALGGSKAGQMEAMQSHLPIALHGKPESVFYLGLGTGITAGTSLAYPVKTVVVAELVNKVIIASKRYFSDFTNALFDDERVRVVNEDGRHFLRATQQQFDLMIADLFIPWRAGVGNLYALEHYQTALSKLNHEGLYVQWIPMYQVSENEFAVIAKTMQQVFPLVTVWRGDFFANKPVMALIGHQSSQPLATHSAFRQLGIKALRDYPEKKQVPLLSHFVGQLKPDLRLFENSPINTDNLPIIEYQAPRSHRAEKNGSVEWLSGPYLLELMHQMRETQSGFLEGVSEVERNAIHAGYFLHAAQIAKEIKDDRAHRSAMRQFNQLLPK